MNPSAFRSRKPVLLILLIRCWGSQRHEPGRGLHRADSISCVAGVQQLTPKKGGMQESCSLREASPRGRSALGERGPFRFLERRVLESFCSSQSARARGRHLDSAHGAPPVGAQLRFLGSTGAAVREEGARKGRDRMQSWASASTPRSLKPSRSLLRGTRGKER